MWSAQESISINLGSLNRLLPLLDSKSLRFLRLQIQDSGSSTTKPHSIISGLDASQFWRLEHVEIATQGRLKRRLRKPIANFAESLPSLSSLSIPGAVVPYLQPLPRLRELHIAGELDGSRRDTSNISECTQLRKLTSRNLRLDDSELISIEKMPLLQEVDFRIVNTTQFLSNNVNDFFKFIDKSMPNLKLMYIAWERAFTSDEVSDLLSAVDGNERLQRLLLSSIFFSANSTYSGPLTLLGWACYNDLPLLLIERIIGLPTFSVDVLRPEPWLFRACTFNVIDVGWTQLHNSTLLYLINHAIECKDWESLVFAPKSERERSGGNMETILHRLPQTHRAGNFTANQIRAIMNDAVQIGVPLEAQDSQGFTAFEKFVASAFIEPAITGTWS
jgi:hypothetical protein